MPDHEEPTVGDEDASAIDESGRNPTQQRLDDEPGGGAPADVSWDPDAEDEREAEVRRST